MRILDIQLSTTYDCNPLRGKGLPEMGMEGNHLERRNTKKKGGRSVHSWKGGMHG